MNGIRSIRVEFLENQKKKEESKEANDNSLVNYDFLENAFIENFGRIFFRSAAGKGGFAIP